MKLLDLSETGVEASVSVLYEVFQKPGAVALVPTETVYGLVARADDELARQRIFQLKNRPASKQIGWFIGDWRDLAGYGVILDGLPERLAQEYTPGAITIIAPCKDGSTQGFRVPDHPLLGALLKKISVPMLQTSANASGFADPLSCQEALKQLAGTVDCAVDGGVLPPGARGSTVVDACGERVKILRQGDVDLQKWI